MITGGRTSLPVADVGRSARFFVETLGFKETRRESDAWAEIDAGGGLTVRLVRRAEPAGSGAAERAEPASACALSFEVNIPLDDAVAVLDNRGVVFEGPPRTQEGRRAAWFHDLDGNPLYLIGD